MSRSIKILLQTTIPYEENNWHIGRFSLLYEYLRSMRAANGSMLFEVTARDREPTVTGDDPLLNSIDEMEFDEVWLMASDCGNGLTDAEAKALNRFRLKGGGILTTRDHEDLGSSLCSIDGVGRANFFHSTNLEPDEARRIRDDRDTAMIDFPNYHSGRNGDYQKIAVATPAHPLLKRRDGTDIEYFPAHPHEGAVGVPSDDSSARIIACGQSKISGAFFNLIVAFERDHNGATTSGRAAVHSSFHHFADYNWNPAMGCPDFVSEPPGDGFTTKPAHLDDIKAYIFNLARWLTPPQMES